MLHSDPSLPPPLTAYLQIQEAARLLSITEMTALKGFYVNGKAEYSF